MPGATLHILQLTDTHIYADPQATLGGMNTRDSFAAVLAAVRAAPDPIDLVLMTGDLAAEAEAEAYDWLVGELSSIGAPVSWLPGNHDVNRIMAPIVGAGGWLGCGSYRYGDWHLLLLDSVVEGREYGALGAAELASLTRHLERYPETPTLVVLHHQPVPLGSRWMDTMTLRDAPAFWRILDQHRQVRAVLFGHVHQNYDAYRGRVRLLATPSTCVQFEPRSTGFAIDTRAPGYRRLQLGPGGAIATQVVRLGTARVTRAVESIAQTA